MSCGISTSHVGSANLFAVDSLSFRNLTPDKYSVEDRLRHKLRRWQHPDPAAHVARQVVRNFQMIRKYCRPAISAVYFRALFNGWPTISRMRTMEGAAGVGKCIFGCETGVDRLEHYACCPVAWHTFAVARPEGVGLPMEYRSLHKFLLPGPNS